MPDIVNAYDVSPTKKVQLFIFDLTLIGYLAPYYITNFERDFTWDSHVFTTFPIVLEGISLTNDGTDGKPKLTLSNVGSDYILAFNNIPNLKGASLTYIETSAGYETTSDYDLKLQYKFSQLTSQNPIEISYTLQSLTDLGNMKYPRRQMLREGSANNRFPGLGVNKSYG